MSINDKVINLEFDNKKYELAKIIIENLICENSVTSIRNTKEFLAILIQLSEFDNCAKVNFVNTKGIRLELRRKLEEYKGRLKDKENSEGIKDISMIKRYLSELCKYELLIRRGEGKYEFNKAYFGSLPIDYITKLKVINTLEKDFNIIKDYNKQKVNTKCEYIQYYTEVDLFKVDIINLDTKLDLYNRLKGHLRDAADNDLLECIDKYEIDYVEKSLLVNETELEKLEEEYKGDNGIKLNSTSVILCKTLSLRELESDDYDDLDKEENELVQYYYFITADNKYYRSIDLYKKDYEDNLEIIMQGVDKEFKSYKELKEDKNNPDFITTEEYIETYR